MKKISDFDILRNDIFYRSWHILDYIQAHKDMSELDYMAIKATIMDALVHYNLIDKEKDKLDLNSMTIGNIENGYSYEENPDVQGFPCWLKEKMREKCIYVSGGVPVSIFVSRPNGTSKCVYDLNIAMSSIFTDFTLYEVNYNSPTRVGKKAVKRPFIEVDINGVKYLIDTLTKRLFKSDYFKEKYGFEVITKKSFNEFTEEDLEQYKKMIGYSSQFSNYINYYAAMRPFFSNIPEVQEHEYELECSKELYPNDWMVQDELNKKILDFKQEHESVLKKYVP